jgi:hypothetical protein
MNRAAVPFLAALFASCFAPRAEAADFALIASSNQSPDESLPELRYADDDGIAYARLMTDLGARTLLFVTPDRDTKTLHPRVPIAGRASLAALQLGFERLAAWVQEQKQNGERTRVYIFLAAHGDVRNGQPFLQLETDRLWREDLVQLLGQTGADETHVVVDACYGALFIAARGPGGDAVPVPLGFSSQAEANWPAHTGLIAARSSGEQSHEWSEFQAGVFSHEVRSGLRGAADADLDGRVSYRELAAFVERANAAVPNARYRPQIAVKPLDGNLDAALADLRRAPFVIELDLPDNGHLVLESGRGVRLADAHPEAGAQVKLYLGDSDAVIYVRREKPALELRVEAHPGKIALSSLPRSAPSATVRGPAHEAFRHLFALPFAAHIAHDYVPPTGVDRSRPPPHPIEVGLQAGLSGMFGNGGYSSSGFGGAVSLGRALPPGFSLHGRFSGAYFGSAFKDSKDVRTYVLDASLLALFRHARGSMEVSYGPSIGAFFGKERFFLRWDRIFTKEELAALDPERPSRDTISTGLQAGFGTTLTWSLGRVRLGPQLGTSLLFPFYQCTKSERYDVATHCKGAAAPYLTANLSVVAAY